MKRFDLTLRQALAVAAAIDGTKVGLHAAIMEGTDMTAVSALEDIYAEIHEHHWALHGLIEASCPMTPEEISMRGAYLIQKP